MAVGFPTKVDYLTGDVLTATNMNDLAGTVNLLTSAYESAAGVNKILNGDFGINQRAFTSTTTTNTYGFDRWVLQNSDGTVTYTPQTFTAGAAPVAGYEGTNFAQIVTTGQTLTSAFATLSQRIESVRTLAGQTATISFWAKANTGTPNVLVAINQNFGSGGSPSASVSTLSTVQTITTSWVRYSFTIAVPSISGKTLGTSNDGFVSTQIFVSGGSTSAAPTVGIQSNTFGIWGVQVEAGPSLSDFKTATGTKQGELAACQRYYIRYGGNNVYEMIGNGSGQTATVANILIPIPVQMRAIPSAIDFSTVGLADYVGGLITVTPTLTASSLGQKSIAITATAASGITAFRPYFLLTNNSLSGYLGLSAEL